MATIRCILDYDSNGLQTTYQIAFDAQDKLQLVGLKAGITLKGNGSSGTAVRAAINNGGTVAEGSRHTVQQAEIKVPPIDPSTTADVDPTKFGTLTVALDDFSNFNLAHFECSWPNGTAAAKSGLQFPEPPFGS